MKTSFIPFLAYEASAGSGKTFNLVVRYLSLLFQGEDASTITALTFTNKAANEMLERVIETFNHLENRNELHEIARLCGVSSEEILSKKSAVFENFLRSEIHISTIDTFFGTILRKFALNAGISPTYTAATVHHEVKLMQRFLTEVDVHDEMETLCRFSFETSKRINDIFKLLGELYAKHKELQHIKITPRSFPYNPIERGLQIARIISDKIIEKGISDRAVKTMNFSTFDEVLKANWVYKPSLNYWDYKKGFSPELDDYLYLLQEAILFEMQRRDDLFFGGLFRLLNLYIKSRKGTILQSDVLTFDDITLAVYDLLQGNIDSEFLYFRLDSRVKHLLLDEFQDTSIIQFDILRPLIDEIHAGKGINEGGSFFFVGDVKQSIYRFRGGVSALFYEVANYFDVEVKPLKVNYRSNSEIVKFVNKTFEEKMSRYIPQESSREGGYVEVVVTDNIFQKILEAIHALTSQGVLQEDIAILTLTNSDGAKIEELLEENGFDVVSETTAKLLHQRSVKILNAFFRYCYFKEEIYRFNCASLLGVEPKDIVISETKDLLDSAIEFIKLWKIADKSALLYLENIDRYRDLEELVFEVDRMELKAPNSDLTGIRVMTVHKSKGLEFNHVIVCDRLGQSNSRSDAIVYEYEGIRLQKIFYRIKGRELLDKEYSIAIEKEKILSKDDQFNGLYVALTRAIESLWIVKKEKGSWFEPLMLESVKYGTASFQATQKSSFQNIVSFDYRGEFYGKHEELMHGEDKLMMDYEAVQFGLALHYGLEMLKQFDIASLEDAMNSVKYRYAQLIGDSGLNDIFNRITTLINDSFFKSILTAEYYQEQRFRLNDKNRIIDLLIKAESDKWIVIDYKTSKERHEEYREQVKYYIYAITKITNLPCTGYICYLQSNGIEWDEVKI